MQVHESQIKRQQVILTHLGFYKGNIDGIWGPACIEAKKKFERDTSFVPAIPNNGLPFGSYDRFPKGIKSTGKNGLLTYVGKENPLTDAIIAKIEGEEKDKKANKPLIVENDDSFVVTKSNVKDNNSKVSNKDNSKDSSDKKEVKEIKDENGL